MPMGSVYQVWHAQTRLFQEDAAHHVHVADVIIHLAVGSEADELNWVFERTNSLDRPWTENIGVVALVDPCRSTSVGDAIVDSHRVSHRVCALGFRVEPDLILTP